MGTISNCVSPENIQSLFQREFQGQSLPHSKLRSTTLGVTLSQTTNAEAAQKLAEGLARRHHPEPKFPILLRQFYLLYICPNLIPRLQLFVIQLALRWPLLQQLLPSIRKHAAWGALSDSMQILSGEELSTSQRDLLVRQLKAYREECGKLVVIHP